jgi:hypothetical protein
MSAFLEKGLIHNSFNVTKISNEVLLVEDFISKEELVEIFKIIDSTPDKEWFIEYHANLKNFCLEKFGRDDVDNLVSEGKFEITQNWQDKNLNITGIDIQKKIFKRLNDLVLEESPDLHLSGFATIQRMQETVQLKSHTDQHTDPSIRYASILYLNDNYKDGELFFEKLGIELKPKAGSIVLFPGDSKHEHGVRHVGVGEIRYVLVGFIKVPKFYEDNKY